MRRTKAAGKTLEQTREALLSQVDPQKFETCPVWGANGSARIEGALVGAREAAQRNLWCKDHVAVLGHPLWATQFGADPNIIGRTILLDGEPHTGIGVLPAGGAFDRAYYQLWRPLTFKPSNMTRNFHWFGAYARLKRGVTLEKARAQMDAIGARIAHDYPDSNKGWGVNVERYSEVLVGDQVRRSLYVLLAAVGMVLLIGCANLANLTLARGTVREREVAIRSSLGAGRWRLVRQFMTENVLLSMCGGLLGVAVGYATMAGLKLALPPYTFPREATIAMDGRVLLFVLLLSVFTGVLFGLAPALHCTRPDLAGPMKEGGRGASAGGARQRVRGALVVAEMALAFVLLTGAGLLIRSFFAMQNVDPGFDSTHAITAGLPIADTVATDRLQSLLLTVFAVIAMLLSAIGIYGVMSYSVVQRTHEIGIRGALGATTSDVLRLILRGGMLMSGFGLLLGFGGALALTRLLEPLLFGAGSRDPLTLAAVAGVLACVAMLACYIPARRASRVDAVVALRYE